MAIVEYNRRAPRDTPKIGEALASDGAAARVRIGPGGPIYVRVTTETRWGGASFGVYVQGSGATRPIAAAVGLVSEGEEWWVEIRYAGDDRDERDVVVSTGVAAVELAVAVFVAPAGGTTQQSRTRLDVRMRAFIPALLEGVPEYSRVVPGGGSRRMIPGPVPRLLAGLPVEAINAAASCYETDNRGFALDPDADSKAVTEFSMLLTRRAGSLEAVLQPEDAAIAHTGGWSTRLDCDTGAVLARRRGQFDPPLGRRALGRPAVAGTTAQVIGQVAIGNPHIIPAPMIDYAFDLRFDVVRRALHYEISLGAFPAFEFHARLGESAFVVVLEVLPRATSAWGLVDLGLGVQMERFVGEKVL